MREAQGTFECPICGLDYQHAHGEGEQIRWHQQYRPAFEKFIHESVKPSLSGLQRFFIGDIEITGLAYYLALSGDSPQARKEGWSQLRRDGGYENPTINTFWDVYRQGVIASSPPSPTPQGAAQEQPKLVLALPDYEKRRIVIASDEIIDDERVVCVAIKDPANQQETVPERQPGKLEALMQIARGQERFGSAERHQQEPAPKAEDGEALPPLPSADDCIVHIYPSDLARCNREETSATVFSVAVGSPDEKSTPLYTANQMREYARAAIASSKQAEDARRYRKLMEEVGFGSWGVARIVIVDRMGATDEEWMDDKAHADREIDNLLRAQGGEL